jgi:hypothetical protein
MKKIITPAVREEAELICDVTGKPAVARLIMVFGYGSFRDGDLLKVDLSAEAAEDVLKLLQSKYPQMQSRDDRDGILGPCELCGRSGM